VKVFVSNFKVEKSENLDNTFYVFTFFDMTPQKHVKSRVFWIFQKRKKRILELWSGHAILCNLALSTYMAAWLDCH